MGNALPFVNVVSGSIGVAASVHQVISRKVVIDAYSKSGRKLGRISGHIEFRKVTFAYPTRPTIAVSRSNFYNFYAENLKADPHYNDKQQGNTSAYLPHLKNGYTLV